MKKTPLPCPAAAACLVTRDESGPWGQASTQIVHLVFDDQAVALITSADGGRRASGRAGGKQNRRAHPDAFHRYHHDGNQFALDFPHGTQRRACRRKPLRAISTRKKLQRVVLLTQDDHDGRVGGEEFEKAAREMNAPAPMQNHRRARQVSEGMRLQTGNCESAPGRRHLDRRRHRQSARGTPAGDVALRAALPVPQGGARRLEPSEPASMPRLQQPGRRRGLGRVRAVAQAALHQAFAQRYRQRFGAEPGIGAAEAYDAVRVLAASLRQSGPNRARLRDALGQVSAFAGASGVISFDHAGNDLTQISLVRLD